MTPTMPDRSAWAWNPRMLLTVLFCSLALNLMVVGTMVGQTLRPVPPSLPSGTAARLAHDASAPLVQGLSEAKRAEVRAIFEANRGQNRALWNTVRERRAEVTRLLEAEAFEQPAYVAAMTRLIEAEAKARTAAQGTFAAVAAVLTPKERRDFLTTHRQLRQQMIGHQREGRRER